MSQDEFEAAVADALDALPDDVLALLDDVVVLVADEPRPEQDEDVAAGRVSTLLGLYEGVPRTERGEWWAAGSLPDRITVFRGPTLRLCADREEVLDEVGVTVVHEIAHHLGIGEERLHELGWG